MYFIIQNQKKDGKKLSKRCMFRHNQLNKIYLV